MSLEDGKNWTEREAGIAFKKDGVVHVVQEYSEPYDGVNDPLNDNSNWKDEYESLAAGLAGLSMAAYLGKEVEAGDDNLLASNIAELVDGPHVPPRPGAPVKYLFRLSILADDYMVNIQGSSVDDLPSDKVEFGSFIEFSKRMEILALKFEEFQKEIYKTTWAYIGPDTLYDSFEFGEEAKRLRIVYETAWEFFKVNNVKANEPFVITFPTSPINSESASDSSISDWLVAVRGLGPSGFYTTRSSGYSLMKVAQTSYLQRPPFIEPRTMWLLRTIKESTGNVSPFTEFSATTDFQGFEAKDIKFSCKSPAVSKTTPQIEYDDFVKKYVKPTPDLNEYAPPKKGKGRAVDNKALALLGWDDIKSDYSSIETKIDAARKTSFTSDTIINEAVTNRRKNVSQYAGDFFMENLPGTPAKIRTIYDLAKYFLSRMDIPTLVSEALACMGLDISLDDLIDLYCDWLLDEFLQIEPEKLNEFAVWLDSGAYLPGGEFVDISVTDIAYTIRNYLGELATGNIDQPAFQSALRSDIETAGWKRFFCEAITAAPFLLGAGIAALIEAINNAKKEKATDEEKSPLPPFKKCDTTFDSLGDIPIIGTLYDQALKEIENKIEEAMMSWIEEKIILPAREAMWSWQKYCIENEPVHDYGETNMRAFPKGENDKQALASLIGDEDWLKKLFNALTPLEICSLLNSQNVPNDLLRYVHKFIQWNAPSAVKVKVSEPSKVVSFFKTLGEIVDTEFCEGIEAAFDQQLVIDPCDDQNMNLAEKAKRRALKARGLSETEISEQIIDEKQRIKDDIRKSLKKLVENTEHLSLQLEQKMKESISSVLKDSFKQGNSTMLDGVLASIGPSFSSDILRFIHLFKRDPNFLEKITKRIESIVDNGLIKFGDTVLSDQKTPAGESGTISKYHNYSLGIIGEIPLGIELGIFQPAETCIEMSRHTALMRFFMDEVGWKPVVVETSGKYSGTSGLSPEDLRKFNLAADHAEDNPWRGWPNAFYAHLPGQLSMQATAVKSLLHGPDWTQNINGSQGSATFYDPAGLRFKLTSLTEQQIEDLANAAFRYYTRYSWNYTEESIARSYADPDRGLRQHALEEDMVPKRDFNNIVDANFHSFTFNPVKDLNDSDWADALANVNLLFGHRGPAPWNNPGGGSFPAYWQPGTNSADSVTNNGYKFAGDSWTDLLDRLNKFYGQGTSGYDERSHGWGLLGGSGWNIQSSKECLLRIFLFRFYLESVLPADDIVQKEYSGRAWNSIAGGHMERALDYYRNGIEYAPGFSDDLPIMFEDQKIRVQRRKDAENYSLNKTEYNVINYLTEGIDSSGQKYVIEVSGPEEGEKIELEDISRLDVCPSIIFCGDWNSFDNSYTSVHGKFLDEFKGIYAEEGGTGIPLGAISKGEVRFYLLPQLPDERKTKEDGGSGCIIDRFEIQAGQYSSYSEKFKNVEISDNNNVPTYAKAVEIFANKNILGEDIIEPGKLQYPNVVGEPLPPQVFQRYLMKKTGDMLVPFSKTPSEQNKDWGSKTLFNEIFKENLLSSDPPSNLDFTARRTLYGGMFASLLKRIAKKIGDSSKNIDPKTPERFALLKLDLENIKNEAIANYDQLMQSISDVTDPSQVVTMKDVLVELPDPALVKAAVKVYLMDFVLRTIGAAGVFKVEDALSDRIVVNFITTTILSQSKDILGKYFDLDENNSVNNEAFSNLVVKTIKSELVEITEQLKNKVYTNSDMPPLVDAIFEDSVIDLAGIYQDHPDGLKVIKDKNHSNARVASRFRNLVGSGEDVPFYNRNATYSGYRHWTESGLIKNLGFVLEKYIKITFKSLEDIKLEIENKPELVSTLDSDNYTPYDIAKKFHDIPVEYRGEMFANENASGLPVYLSVDDFKQYYTEFIKDFSQYGDLTPENLGAPAGSIFGWKQNKLKYQALSEDFYNSIEELKNQTSTVVDITPKLSAILQEEVALLERICPLVPAGNKSGQNPWANLVPELVPKKPGEWHNINCPIIWDVADISCPKSSVLAPFANPINYGENPYYDEHYNIKNTRDLVDYVDVCWTTDKVKSKIKAVDESTLGGLSGSRLKFRRRHIKQMAPLSEDLSLQDVFGQIPNGDQKMLANIAFRYYTLAYYGDYTAFKYESPIDELSLQAINVIFGGWNTIDEDTRGSWYKNDLPGGDFYDTLGNPLLKGLVHSNELNHPTLPGYRRADELAGRLFPADPYRKRINNVWLDPYPGSDTMLACAPWSESQFRMGSFLWKDDTHNPVQLSENNFAWGRFKTKEEFIKYMLYGLFVGFDAPYYASWFGAALDPDSALLDNTHRVVDAINRPKSEGGALVTAGGTMTWVSMYKGAPSGHPDDQMILEGYGKGTEFLDVAVADWIKERRWTPARGVDMYRALDLYKNGDPAVLSAETGQPVSPLEVFTEGKLVTDDMQNSTYDNLLEAPLSLITHDVSYGLRLSYAGGDPFGPKYKSGFRFVKDDLFPDFKGQFPTGDWINNTEDREHLTMKRIKSFLITEPKIDPDMPGTPKTSWSNRHVFTIPLLEQDTSISVNATRFGELLNQEWFSEEGNLPSLWSGMKGTDSFKLLFEYLFPIKRMLGILTINNIMTFENAAEESNQTQEAKFIFYNTKEILEQTIGSLKGFTTIKDYQLTKLAADNSYEGFIDIELLQQAVNIDLNSTAISSLKESLDNTVMIYNLNEEEDL